MIYDRVISVHTIRLIEGSVGGTQIHAEGLVGENWYPLDSAVLSTQPDPAIPYQIFDFVLPGTLELSGIRVRIETGGRLAEASVLELDAVFAGSF